MKKRQFLKSICAAALLPAPAIAGLNRELRILTPKGSEAALAPVARRFQERHGIEVAVNIAPLDQINGVILLKHLSGDVDFDVALPATFGLPDLIDVGAILPLDAFEDSGGEEGTDTGSLYRAGDHFDGRRYGFQTDGDAYLMFYNADWLEDPRMRGEYEDRYGRPLAVPETWAALDQQLAFFHRPEEGMIGGTLFRNSTYLVYEWWCRLHASGIWPLSPDLTPQIAGDAGIAALDCMRKTSAFLTGKDNGLVDNWERYARGDVFCNIGWGGTQKYLHRAGSAMRGKLRHGLTPGVAKGSSVIEVSCFNWGWSYVVSGVCRDPELAYRFCHHAVSPSVSTEAVRQSAAFFDPFRREHYADPEIQAVYSPEFLDVHEQAMAQAFPDFYLARRSDYFSALASWLAQALRGEVSSREALERVAEEWTLIQSKVDLSAQKTRWQSLRAKYPAALQAVMQDL